MWLNVTLDYHVGYRRLILRRTKIWFILLLLFFFQDTPNLTLLTIHVVRYMVNELEKCVLMQYMRTDLV